MTEELAKKRDDVCGVVRLDPYVGALASTNYVCCYCGEKWLTKPSIVWAGVKGHVECSNIEVGKKLRKFAYGEIPNKFWLNIINSAKDRNIYFDLSVKDIWDLFLKQNRRCYYTDIEIFFKKNRKSLGTASIDRIDSSKGYIIDNVVWCHKDINIMKVHSDKEKFIEYCNLIAENHPENKFTYSY